MVSLMFMQPTTTLWVQILCTVPGNVSCGKRALWLEKPIIWWSSSSIFLLCYCPRDLTNVFSYLWAVDPPLCEPCLKPHQWINSARLEDVIPFLGQVDSTSSLQWSDCFIVLKEVKILLSPRWMSEVQARSPTMLSIVRSSLTSTTTNYLGIFSC